MFCSCDSCFFICIVYGDEHVCFCQIKYFDFCKRSKYYHSLTVPLTFLVLSFKGKSSYTDCTWPSNGCTLSSMMVSLVFLEQ